jgi:uncharacterized protein (TIGR03000 family)
MHSLLVTTVLGLSTLGQLSGESAAQAAALGVQTPTDTAVLISVEVPADAKIWFGDTETSQRGTFRRFLSPPLSPGREYVYRVRVRWMEGNRAVDLTRSLAFHARDRLHVSFTSPSSIETRAYYAPGSTSYGATETRTDYYAPNAPVSRSSNGLLGPSRSFPSDSNRSRFYDPNAGLYSPPGPPSSNSPLSLGAGQG